MASFLSELKRRDVFRVGFAYAAIGWLVVEIISVVFPIFDAPKWVVQVFVTLILLGFPIALVLAWVFELTPEGFVRTTDAPGDAAAATQAGRRLNAVIIATVVAVAGLLVVHRFTRDEPGSDASVVQTDESAIGPSTAGALVAHRRQSVVVLPFVNLSSDPEQEYFSDGLTEELLNRLAQIRELRVPARTSSFQFKGKTDLAAVKAALDVRHAVEGSVRRSGQNLRITARLVDLEAGHDVLWSGEYNEEMTEVFAVQDRITRAIVAALQLRLADDALPLQARSTVPPELYQLMLRGRFHWNERSEEGLAKAVELFSEAAEKHPDYAPAYAGLADAYLSQFDYGLISWEDSTAKARAAATTALELDPMLAEAHTSLAHILLHEWQWQAAEQSFLRSIDLDPNYVVARHWYALCLTALGRTDEAVQTMERAQEIDPLSTRINVDVGMAYLAAGRYEEAIAQEGRTLELAPDAVAPMWIRAMALEQLGRFGEAEVDLHAVLDAWGRDASVLGSLGHVYAMAGRQAQAREVLAEIAAQEDSGDVAFFAALVTAGLGEIDATFDWLDQAVAARSGSVRYLKIDPRLGNLRQDPRYPALLERVGLPLT